MPIYSGTHITYTAEGIRESLDDTITTPRNSIVKSITFDNSVLTWDNTTHTFDES